jgi:hypothetical protein
MSSITDARYIVVKRGMNFYVLDGRTGETLDSFASESAAKRFARQMNES